ncbi:MAG: methyltransferase domain-containing protein [Alphaproteobacteria bacterium]|nr:methyltransferase domain-containing protein [Alphaproteobacteria bacterium]
MDRVAANGSRRRRSPALLHFRRFLAHPVRLSSMLPVSRAVARMVASRVDPASGDYVVELGSGTGAVTRALLEAGVPATRLIAVEIDSEMAAYLAEVLPDITMIHGSATDIGQLLPAEARGRVGAVICGVPVSMLGMDEQLAMIKAMLALKPHDGRFLAYSYRPGSPLRAARLGLTAERLDFTLRNALPASVWAFRAAGAGCEQGT